MCLHGIFVSSANQIVSGWYLSIIFFFLARQANIDEEINNEKLIVFFFLETCKHISTSRLLGPEMTEIDIFNVNYRICHRII